MQNMIYGTLNLEKIQQHMESRVILATPREKERDLKIVDDLRLYQNKISDVLQRVNARRMTFDQQFNTP